MTEIVDALWGRQRPVTVEDRQEIVQTIIENILGRGSPSEFVTDVPDLTHSGKRIDLHDQGRLFMTKLSGIFGSKGTGTYKLRLMLENALRPFVHANKKKFPDIFGQQRLHEAAQSDARSDLHQQPGDYYRPGKEQPRRDSKPPPRFKVEEKEDGEASSRARSSASSPENVQSGAGVERCHNCGDARHKIEDCWKGTNCLFCMRGGHPTEACKYRTGEWKYPPRPRD